MLLGDIGYVSLWVPDVGRAQTFFGTVLGWAFAPGSGVQSRQVDGATPHHGLWGGQERSTLFLGYWVDDVDAAVARVRAAGGVAEEATEAPHGKVVNCVDDQGTFFAVFRAPPGEHVPRQASNGSRQGDLAYVTLEVVDSSRTRAFYGATLGWRFTPGAVDDGWQVDDVRPMTGVHGGHASATAVPMYLVDEIGGAAERARAAGGTASEPERQPYGLSSECVDDQGTRFSLGELPAF
jgi:predicted enzyme related to lactoylglutathione lyase